MSLLEVETRLTRLEAEVAQIKARVSPGEETSAPWWEEISGVFKDDPLFDEAERLGREWREAQRSEVNAEPDVSA